MPLLAGRASLPCCATYLAAVNSNSLTGGRPAVWAALLSRAGMLAALYACTSITVAGNRHVHAASIMAAAGCLHCSIARSTHALFALAVLLAPALSLGALPSSPDAQPPPVPHLAHASASLFILLHTEGWARWRRQTTNLRAGPEDATAYLRRDMGGDARGRRRGGRQPGAARRRPPSARLPRGIFAAREQATTSALATPRGSTRSPLRRLFTGDWRSLAAARSYGAARAGAAYMRATTAHTAFINNAPRMAAPTGTGAAVLSIFLALAK